MKYINGNEDKAVNELVRHIKENGLTVEYKALSSGECFNLREEINRLLLDKEIKIWTDTFNSDKRIFGADQVSQMFFNHQNRSLINSVIDGHEKTNIKSGFTMAAKMDFKQGNPGSGDGWHRDRPDRWQTKSITYLSDVSLKNGPFQYIKKSHRPLSILTDWIRYGIKPSQSRFPNHIIERIIQQEPHRLVTCTGNEGDILFANTLGIHRGMPIQEGSRYAATTYFWSDIDIPSHIRNLMQK